MGSFRLIVDELGPLADGIGFSKQGKVYLDRVVPGDEVEANLKKDKKGVLRGQVTNLIKASSFRQDPSCPHYDLCGNCSLQHVNTHFYQAWKQEKVKMAFSNFGLKPQEWLPSIFLKGNNRRRVTFSLTKVRGQVFFGYYQRRSQNITEIDQCDVITPDILELKRFLKAILSPLLKEKQVVDIFLQKVGSALDVVFSGLDSLPANIIDQLCDLEGVKRISLKSSKGIQVVSRNKSLSMRFGELSVALPPAAFLQPTEEGEQTLVSSILKALPPGQLFADLFCGVGTFTGPLLEKGAVHGFEENPHAVRALSQAGKSKPLKVFQKDLFAHPLKVEELNRYDAIIFDPPRAGCSEQAKLMARSLCSHLIGISCNPATFARDASYLVKGGYRLKSLQVIDQFLWSHHVEVIGVFSRA